MCCFSHIKQFQQPPCYIGVLSCNIELVVGKISYVGPFYISYMAPDPYHLSVQGEETWEEGTLMGALMLFFKCDQVWQKGTYSLSNCVTLWTHSLKMLKDISLKFSQATVICCWYLVCKILCHRPPKKKFMSFRFAFELLLASHVAFPLLAISLFSHASMC